MSASQTESVTIIGSGITGLSCAWHLRQAGIAALVVSPTLNSIQVPGTCGIALGGMSDNFTRIHHARGGEIAEAVWSFGNTAVKSIHGFCEGNLIRSRIRPRQRIASSEIEMVENQKAATLLREAGFPAEHLGASPSRPFGCLEERDSAAVIDRSSLFSKLLTGISHRNLKVQAITPVGRGVRLNVENGDAFVSEFVVLAAHLQSSSLYPYVRDWLVSYGDQWESWEVDGDIPELGRYFSWNFGYSWLTALEDQRVAFGGPRFLRSDGGIGETAPTFSERVSSHIQKDIGRIFPSLKLRQRVSGSGFLECRPCDELPIIGPIAGTERVLLGTGYMGQGLSLGFWAGKCLADIIVNGTSSALPEILQPRRLRSLSTT